MNKQQRWAVNIKGSRGLNRITVAVLLPSSDVFDTPSTATVKFPIPDNLRLALYLHGYSERQVNQMYIVEVRYPSDFAPEQSHSIDIVMEHTC